MRWIKIALRRHTRPLASVALLLIVTGSFYGPKVLPPSASSALAPLSSPYALTLASVNTPHFAATPVLSSAALVSPSEAATTTTSTTTPSWAIGNSGPFAVQPGGDLPSDAQCAKEVTKSPETKSANSGPNHNTGNADAATAGNWGTNPGAAQDMKRVTGKYTGTTDEVIQWAACKWGFDPDTVRAQAMVESSWNQTDQGGMETDPATCIDPSLRRLAPTTTSTTANSFGSTTSTSLNTETSTNATPVSSPDDSVPSSSAPSLGAATTTTTLPTGPTYECPTAFGLMQLRSDYQPGTYPLSLKSTAFNLDYSLAMERACYDGVSWLGSPTRGDLFGCVGMHFSGKYLDPPAQAYIGRVKLALATRPWAKL